MTTYRVDLIEYERGWGSRKDGCEYFSGENAFEKALAYQKKFNSTNTEPSAPDWYMIAEKPILVPDEEAPKKTSS